MAFTLIKFLLEMYSLTLGAMAAFIDLGQDTLHTFMSMFHFLTTFINRINNYYKAYHIHN